MQRFLAGLPASAAVKLTEALERDRVAGNAGLPHEAILAGLRPALANTRPRPSRVPTPLRLFCRPFEDLIFPGHRAAKQVGRIARGSILPVWDWLGTDLMGPEFGQLCGRLAKHILAGDAEAIRGVAVELHGKGGEALSRALDEAVPGSSGYDRIARRLGGGLVVEDARDIGRVLEIAGDIVELLECLPEPIEILTEDAIADVHRVYERVADVSPLHAPYVIFVTLGRMRRPWEILRVLDRLRHTSADALASSADLRLCLDLLSTDQSVSGRYGGPETPHRPDPQSAA